MEITAYENPSKGPHRLKGVLIFPSNEKCLGHLQSKLKDFKSLKTFQNKFYKNILTISWQLELMNYLSFGAERLNREAPLFPMSKVQADNHNTIKNRSSLITKIKITLDIHFL